jgi:hypothetical protein
MRRFRVKATDFTRQRVLSGPVVVVLMLSGHKVSMQKALNKFFGVLGRVWQVVTASAYSQARQKVQPEVFKHLNAVACEEYYTHYGADHEVELWHGQRVLGWMGVICLCRIRQRRDGRSACKRINTTGVSKYKRWRRYCIV